MNEILIWESACNNLNSYVSNSGYGYTYRVIFEQVRNNWVAFSNNGYPDNFANIEIGAVSDEFAAQELASEHWREQYSFYQKNQLEWEEQGNNFLTYTNPAYIIVKVVPLVFIVSTQSENEQMKLGQTTTLEEAKRLANIFWVGNMKATSPL